MKPTTSSPRLMEFKQAVETARQAQARYSKRVIAVPVAGGLWRVEILN